MSIYRAICFAVGLALAAVAGGSLPWIEGAISAESSDYNPVINPEHFRDRVDNKYFTLKPGTIFTYSSTTPLGEERIEIAVTRETRKIMGVTAIVVRAREWLNNRLKEDTRDWYAQDKDGNVWYFGEAVDNYDINGNFRDHAGSWEAGTDGAKPGIIMRAEPKVGDTYRQEYYKGITEDMGTVVAVGKTVAVPYATFYDCVQIRDWSKIDATANEHKYYCPTVSFLALEVPLQAPEQKVELVGVVLE